MYDGFHNPALGKPSMPDKLPNIYEPVNLLQLDRVTTAKLARDGELPALRAHVQRRYGITGYGKHWHGLSGSV
jgi:hypothetical protein